MSTNEVTGDKLVTKNTTDAYRDNWDAIWGKSKNIQRKQAAEFMLDMDKRLTEELTEKGEK